MITVELREPNGNVRRIDALSETEAGLWTVHTYFDIARKYGNDALGLSYGESMRVVMFTTPEK